MSRPQIFPLLLLLSLLPAALPAAPARQEKKGWIHVQLSGSPREIGLQHARLLHREIADGLKAIQINTAQQTKKDWAFFRTAAKEVLWPRVDAEYREELQGIADGLKEISLKEKGLALDLWDVVALNGWMELAWYYVPIYDRRHNIPTPSTVNAPEHCSAFIATGSYTKDRRIVSAHNAWVDYMVGERWNIIFDITPTKGHRMLMDGYPGLIHSGDDFGINAKGILITETTISNFLGFDDTATPEFVRARKSLQYADSIDSAVDLLKTGNNGGYANTWLIGDNKTSEIARLELGLKNVTLERTKDGYFAGSNFPINEKLIREETNGWDPNDKGNSAIARHTRWDQLMAADKGKIGLAEAKRYMADDLDTFDNKREANERTLCGRIDLSPRGSGGWQPPHGPAGAVQNKATTATMIDKMQIEAAYGPQCGTPFKAADFLKAHKEFDWMRPSLIDMPKLPWTLFTAK
jgi:hypothetical protein